MKDDKTVNASNVDVGTSVDVEAIMRKYDRESNTRIWEGAPKIIVGCLLAAFSVFCLYVTLFANFLEQVRLSSFMGMIVVMGFLIFPARKGHVRVNDLPWYDVVLMILGAGAFFYYAFGASRLLNMRLALKLRDPMYIAVGIVGLLVLAELCRRSVGVPILCVAAFFLVYTIINFVQGGRSLAQLPHELFYGENGVLTTPVNVCSKYIVVFIIFGAFLERTGISDFFINLANSVAGASAGGPAKVAVIASAFEGMVSGSSVANTVGSGSVTIPMMKKLGYNADFAGAVEAAASTGGQIMPPVMGAAAFLMADYVGVPYSNIIVRAILPAVLYFLGIFIAVHLEAKKLGLRGLDRSELPRIRELIGDTYLLLPLLVLVYLVCSNAYTMQFAAAMSILATVLAGFASNYVRYVRNKKANVPCSESAAKAILNPQDGFTPRKIFDALEAGGRGSISVAAACGIAGIICGCITATGLASKAINFIFSISKTSTLLALFMTMICCIVLGMGVPTTANYCIMASTCAPILIKMGIPTVAAHFFVFYFGIVADITPPVALAAYAGSAISKGNPMKTGVIATRLAIAAFIIPYVFAFSPSMLFIDTVWYEVVQIGLSSVIGMYGIAAALSGFMFKKMSWLECLVAAGGGLLLIIPGTLTDVCGVALVGVVIAAQLIGRKRAKAVNA